MKITFFIGGISGGGAERVVCNLANYLSGKNNNCTILTMSESENTYGLKENIKIQSLLKRYEHKNFIIDNFKRVNRLIRYMKKEKCDTYIVFLPITTILFLIFRRFTKAQVIVSERAAPDKYSKPIQFLLKKLASRADVWVFQTEDARKWYKDVVKKAVIIPNAINEEFIHAPFSGVRRKVIVGAGRLSNQKNFTMLINAFADISSKFVDYNLEIYGEGEKKEELEQLAKERMVSDRVSFPGYVANLGERIQDAALFVLSSDFEGMPNALIEAMALGLPCISTDCPMGGPNYLIKQGVNGYLIPVGDKDALVKSMILILNQKDLSEKLSKEALKIVDILNPTRIYKKWEDIISRQNIL